MKLWIGNFPQGQTENDVMQSFSRLMCMSKEDFEGRVTDMHLPNEENCKCRSGMGYLIMVMDSRDMAEHVQIRVNGAMWTETMKQACPCCCWWCFGCSCSCCCCDGDVVWARAS
jgi:hypothetical protein